MFLTDVIDHNRGHFNLSKTPNPLKLVTERFSAGLVREKKMTSLIRLWP